MTNILALPVATVTGHTGTNEDFRDQVAFNDQSGNPLSLSGITFTSELRATANAAQAFFLAKNSDGTLVISGAGSNVLGFAVPAATMAKATPGPCVYDVVASADGVTRRVVIGSLTVLQGVTR